MEEGFCDSTDFKDGKRQYAAIALDEWKEITNGEA